MRYIVVKTLPNGQKPGEELDLPEIVGRALVAAGAIRVSNDTDVTPSRRGYRRRDLKARD